MSAAETLARAEAAGVRLRLRPDGGVGLEAAAPPPADVLADLRRWREDVARLLVERDGQPECGPVPPGEHDAAAGAARAAFYFAASERAREALATPDADLVAERAEILAAHEAEARGEYPIKPEGEHRAHIAALLLGARLRLPAWGDPSGPTGGAVAKVRK